MEVSITSRNVEMDNYLKGYIQRRLGKFEKSYSRIYRTEVILEEEKLRKNVEVIIYLKKNKVVAKESSPDIYASIDQAAESVKKQLRRLTGRLRSQRRKLVFKNVMEPMRRFYPGSSGIFPEEKQGIIKTNVFAEKPMLPEEAKIELQTAKKNFLMFRNSETGESNVIYKLDDGNYGLAEPKF